jgi:hypothetical protein
MAVIIKNKFDLPERGSFLKFRLKDSTTWIDGMFSMFEPLRFFVGQSETNPDSKSYQWEEVQEYELYFLRSVTVQGEL